MADVFRVPVNSEQFPKDSKARQTGSNHPGSSVKNGREFILCHLP
jgi:hypothetical protein